MDFAQSVLLLVAGSLLTLVGGWVADRHAERRRLSVEREKAYIAWLETQTIALAELRSLRDLARNENESLDDDTVVEQLDTTKKRLVDLSARVHACYVFEPFGPKRGLLDDYTEAAGNLGQELGLVVAHQRVHVGFRRRLEGANAAVAVAESVLRELPETATIAHRERATVALRVAQQSRVDGSSHLDACERTLAHDVQKLFGRIDAIEKLAKSVRDTLLLGVRA